MKDKKYWNEIISCKTSTSHNLSANKMCNQIFWGNCLRQENTQSLISSIPNSSVNDNGRSKHSSHLSIACHIRDGSQLHLRLAISGYHLGKSYYRNRRQHKHKDGFKWVDTISSLKLQVILHQSQNVNLWSKRKINYGFITILITHSNFIFKNV